MRSERKAISPDMLIQLALEEHPSLKNLTTKGQRSVIDRFMKAYNLSIRKVTSNHSQSDEYLTQGEIQIIDDFKRTFNKKIIDNNIQEENIFNMDQQGLNYENLPKTTIKVIGSQKVPLATSGGEKKRVTILSLVSYSGVKYQQFVIFKGAPGARIDNSVKRSNDETTFFSVQNNAWTDREQLQIWLQKIWWPIARARPEPKLLLLDSYPLHTEIKSDLEKYNTHVLFIPKGLTWRLQPLDCIFHKEYKKYAREFFNNHQSLIISQEDERRS